MGCDRTERREVMGGEEQQTCRKQRGMEADMPRRCCGERRAGGLDCRPGGWAEQEEKDQVGSLGEYC